MAFSKGTRVRHPTKPDWGVGEVLENSSANAVRVFFVGGGERKIVLEYVSLEIVHGEEASHLVLDNLRIDPKGLTGYLSLQTAQQKFMEKYPQGFHGERFLKEERSYKEAAHTLSVDVLGEEKLAAMIRGCEFHEVCKQAIKVSNATNLIFPNEKMALKDGLKNDSSAQEFSETLFDFLYGRGDLKSRFDAFTATLESIKAAKWTIATYFLYIRYPDKFIFLKPAVTQNAANLSAFEIHYDSKLNWNTYSRVLAFSEYLRSELVKAGMAPRDMIDVQSFMWCIAPD